MLTNGWLFLNDHVDVFIYVLCSSVLIRQVLSEICVFRSSGMTVFRCSDWLSASVDNALWKSKNELRASRVIRICELVWRCRARTNSSYNKCVFVLCSSGDAVHREEAAESPVSISLWTCCVVVVLLISSVLSGHSKRFSLVYFCVWWPLTSAGTCWSTPRVRSKSSPGLRRGPSSQRPWRPPSPASWSTWWTRPAASAPSRSCPTCCTPAGKPPQNQFYFMKLNPCFNKNTFLK